MENPDLNTATAKFDASLNGHAGPEIKLRRIVLLLAAPGSPNKRLVNAALARDFDVRLAETSLSSLADELISDVDCVLVDASKLTSDFIETCLGSWDIALVVFIASVAVPIFKIVALSTLVYLAQVRSTSQLKQRTQLYKVVEFIGQWSMLDVFVVILLSALGRFGNLLTIKPSGGAAAFGCVVILTMLAAMGFDPRLAWRRAGHRRHLSSEHANITLN